ncbi:MAG: trypsin-like peptidase domain-containing protein [Candidatus Bathyarchaeota archaeon]|nr:trypsin-like peptidase domain-containing protein [Candidatus Bathyarchaeota archaeon]
MYASNGYGKISLSLLALLFAAGLLIGALASFYITYQEMARLSEEVASLQNRVAELTSTQNITYQNITIYQNETELANIYESVRDSVVLIQGSTSTGEAQGSGFVYAYSGRNVVITNYHVVHGTTSLSVTFSNGNAYPARVLGSDPYADLAVLSVDAPDREFKPVEIVSSSTLRVGDPVIAIGNPYGLVGSLTTGVVSALGRTITEEEYAGGFAIANIIQTSAPINPGNSGGPLLNAAGKVVGVTTAILSDSQGLGFAVPSNTILREIASLITTGTYRDHSYLGVTGQDMSYSMARQMGVNVTYGWRIASVVSGGPSDGKLKVNDIIIALNRTRIRNNDDLASYLAENTLPGQLLTITVVRGGATVNVDVILGRRPAPPT